NGDGTFTDVTVQARLDAEGLWTAAVFFDIDNDGDEDLFVGHFFDYDPASETACLYGSDYHYCHPLSYLPHASMLYRNDGAGVFADITDSSGVGQSKGKVFGAVATDIND